MSVKPLQYFKDKFKTGYKITQQDYEDWLDSFRHSSTPIQLSDTSGLESILSAYRLTADMIPATEISGLSQFVASLLSNYLTTNSSIPITQVEGLEEALENAGGGSSEEFEELKGLIYNTYFSSFLNNNLDGDLLLALSENPSLFMELVLFRQDVNRLKQFIIDEYEYPDPILKIFALSYLEVIGGAYALAYARNPGLKPQLSSLFYEAMYGYGFSGQPNSPGGISLGAYKQQMEAMSSNPSSYYPFIVYSLVLVNNNLMFIEGLGDNLITFSIDNNIYSVADEVLYVTLSNTPNNTFKIQDFFDRLDVSINISVEVPTSYNGVDFNTTLTTKEYVLGTLPSIIISTSLVLYKFDDDEEDYVLYDFETISEPGEYIYVDANFRGSLSNFPFKTRIKNFLGNMNLILDIPIYHIVVL